MVDPALATKKLEMAQVAPGRYQAEFDVTRPGSYQLMFSQTKDTQLVGRQTRGLAVGYPDELRLRGVNNELLRSIAAASLGRFEPRAESVFDPPQVDCAAGSSVMALPGGGGRVILCAGCGLAANRPDPVISIPAAVLTFHACDLTVQSSDRADSIRYGPRLRHGLSALSVQKGAFAMSERILETLEPVRRRQLVLEMVRCSAIGLLAGSLAAMVMGVLRWQGSADLWTALAASALAGGPLIGALFGLLRGRSITLAAATVDRCYELKDRAVTAIDFLRRGEPTPLHVLQVADAQRHIASIDVRKVAPFRLPRSMPFALAATAVALGLMLWPQQPRVHARPSEPLDAVMNAAIEAEENLESLEETARKENDPKLKELVQKLNETIQEMKLPGVDTKEALAKLSEMQAAITASRRSSTSGWSTPRCSPWAKRWHRPSRSTGPARLSSRASTTWRPSSSRRPSPSSTATKPRRSRRSSPRPPRRWKRPAWPN